MKTKSLLIAAGLVTGSVVASRGQILEQWTHQAVIGEASAAVAMDANYMFVADNEDEYLRLYHRFPSSSCASPAYSYYVKSDLGLSSTDKEVDIEAAVSVSEGAGTRIYWLGSHSNSKTGGQRLSRNRLFATQVNGDGTGPTPYSLTYVGRYDSLRDDLLAWDRNSLHGLGTNYFGLNDSAALGVIPKRIDGFNIEGLAMAPDGTTAYVAFRAPLVNGAGPTTYSSPRTHTLIVPLLNLRALVAGNPTPGAGTAGFGPPITLDLGGRGVRSIDSSYPGHYLITAGPVGDASVPAVPPYNFCLFTWTGHPADAPIEQRTQIPDGLTPEGAMLPRGPITAHTVVQFVSDDLSACWRSFTAHLIPPQPRLALTKSGDAVTVTWPASASGFTLQHCTDLFRGDWVDNNSTVTASGTDRMVVEPASGARFYRLVKP